MAHKYPIDPITLRIDGVDWSHWQSVEVTRQVDAIAGTFSLAIVERWGNADGGMQSMPLSAGLPCELLIGQDPVISGYVDKVSPSFSAGAHGITVTGRDKSADLVDCAAIHKPGQWAGLTCAGLAAYLAAPFGVSVLSEGDVGAPFASFKLEEGEKAFDALDRALKQREVFACPDGKGGIVLLKIGSRDAQGKLQQGVNILQASLEADMAERFSDYVVQGQQPGNDQQWGLAASAVTASVRDKAVTRYRPMLIRPENSVDAASARQRAAWECAVRAGRAVTVSVTVQGFRQLGAGAEQSGPLWDINAMCDVDIPYLRLSQRLLISKVTFKRDLASGSTTRLELRDPAAFKPEPKKTKSSGGAGAFGKLNVEQEMDIQQRMANDAAKANKKAGGAA